MFAPKIAGGDGSGVAKYESDLPTNIRVELRKAKPVGILYKPTHSCIAAQRPTKPLSLYYSVPCVSHWRSTARRRADDISFCTATDDESRYTVFICALNRTPCRKGLLSLQNTPQTTNSYRFFKNKKQVQVLEYWLRKNLKNASGIALPSRTFCPLCGVKI